MQEWVDGCSLPDAIEGGALRTTRRFVRRNRLQFIVAGIAAAVVGVTAVAAAGTVPRVDAVTSEASAVDDFPTELFRDPLGEADTGGAVVTETLPGDVEGDPVPDVAPDPAAPGVPAPGGENPESDLPTPTADDEEPPLGAEAIDFSIRLTPDEVGADGSFYAELVAHNTGDRRAEATVSSIDFAIHGEYGTLVSGTIGFPLRVSVAPGEEWSMGVYADPYFLAAYTDEPPEVIEAGVYTADVTINIDGTAPVAQSLSLTFTESIDLLTRATEQCQAMIDSWGEYPGIVIIDDAGTTVQVESGEDVAFEGGFDPTVPPALEECLAWYGY
ncbi:MAG: hypothetical protein M5U31_15120 [Acidimicrobiia bacterium]|nr:hypothetical protein [Acidimicrobiia bacterium]